MPLVAFLLMVIFDIFLNYLQYIEISDLKGANSPPLKFEAEY